MNSSVNFIAYKKIAIMVSKTNVKKRVLRADRKVMPSDVYFMAVMLADRSLFLNELSLQQAAGYLVGFAMLRR